MIQVPQNPNPTKSGRISAWSVAMTMPMNPTMEPTLRSMLRVTMTKTMPVDITATAAVCTERFHRLRGVRNSPPERMLNTTQTRSRAPIMPSMRVSISVAERNRVRMPALTLPGEEDLSGVADPLSIANPIL